MDNLIGRMVSQADPSSVSARHPKQCYLICSISIWAGEMTFAMWMQSTSLSAKSVDSYIGAIEGRLTSWAINHQFTDKQLVEVTDLQEFLALAAQIRQTSEYKTWNTTGHGMYAAALNHFQRYLMTLGHSGEAASDVYGPHQNQMAQIEAQSVEPFNPTGQADARDRVLREVVRRRGQAKFRQALLAAYERRCAITGCRVVPLLEAAHITPYLGIETNSISNGLLLRADIHTLWDLGLIAVNVATLTVWVNPEVDDPIYQALSGQQLRSAAHFSEQPSKAALRQQWDLARVNSHNEVILAA